MTHWSKTMLRHALCCSIVAFAGAVFAAETDYRFGGKTFIINPQTHQTHEAVICVADDSKDRGEIRETGSQDVKYSYFEALPKDGYKLDHWAVWFYGDTSISTSTKTKLTFEWATGEKILWQLTAFFTNAEYTVTFDLNGGTMAGSSAGVSRKYTYKISKYGSLPEPERTGYEFVGWYRDGSLFTRGEEEVFEETSDFTLVARWEAKPFTVTVKSENCNLDVSRTAGVYGDSIEIDWSPFERPGAEYVFDMMVVRTKDGTVLRSYGKDDSPKTYTMNQEYSPEIVVEGRYLIKGIPYVIHFDGNGGSVSATDIQAQYYSVYTLPTTEAIRKGYTLSGWLGGSPTGKRYALGESVSNLTTTAGGSYTFYADWAGNISTNVYWCNGADDETKIEQIVTYGESYQVLENPSARTGHTFLGWTTNQLLEAEFMPKATISNLTSVAGGKVDFYATWEPISYHCVFDGNEADSGSVEGMDVQYNQVFKLPENGFVRSGFAFTGWGTNATKGTVFQPGDSLSNLTAIADADVPIFARWLKVREGLTALNDALDYYDTPVSNAVKNAIHPVPPGPNADPWLIITNSEKAAKGTQYARAAVGDQENDSARCRMGVWVQGPALLTFKMKSSDFTYEMSDPWGPIGRFLSVEFRDASTDFANANVLTNIIEEIDTWTPVSISVPDGEGWVIWDLQITTLLGATGSAWAEIDDLTISAVAPHPDPQPSDAPTVSAVRFVNGQFGIGFVGDERFNYQLLGTECLQPANWQPVDGTLRSGTGSSQQIEVTFDPLKPSMFYKVEVLKKQ